MLASTAVEIEDGSAQAGLFGAEGGQVALEPGFAEVLAGAAPSRESRKASLNPWPPAPCPPGAASTGIGAGPPLLRSVNSIFGEASKTAPSSAASCAARRIAPLSPGRPPPGPMRRSKPSGSRSHPDLPQPRPGSPPADLALEQGLQAFQTAGSAKIRLPAPGFAGPPPPPPPPPADFGPGRVGPTPGPKGTG